MTRWIIGLAIALAGGAVVIELGLRLLRWAIHIGSKHALPEKSGVREVPGWFTGSLERFFFVVLIANDVQAIAPTMMAWLALKLATNWNHPSWSTEQTAEWRVFAGTALLAGLVSMLFAFIGGWICRGQWRIV